MKNKASYLGWQQLTCNCVENSCKLHTTGMNLLSETDMCSRFLGEINKQTNNQTEKILFYNFFSNGLPDFSVSVWRNDLVLEITYTTAYCLIFWQQIIFICFSVHNLLCIQTEMWLSVLIWKSLKITVFSKHMFMITELSQVNCLSRDDVVTVHPYLRFCIWLW
jgi:hypothetical protein